jgi:galactokinase/mevalonate kinase-like predicted kinase
LFAAGSSGFMVFYAPSERHNSIARILKGLRRINLNFEAQGSKIIFVHN